METSNNLDKQPADEKFWLEALSPIFKDKKVIITGEVIAGLLPRARTIRELGAETTLIIATDGLGTGEQPGENDGDWLTLDLPPCEDVVQAVQASQMALGNLPDEVLQFINDFDPQREAIVVGTFLHEQPTVAGRQSLAYRKPEWLALDDKTVIDDIWDRFGITRESSEIVTVDSALVTEATKRIDKGDGVVLSGDSKEGAGGGATGVRWVRTINDVGVSLEYYRKHCDKLRVMPFLEGIPCSIHGMVFDDYVAAFRPVEMVVLRKENSNEFFYAGTATYWDPTTEDREEMRDIAKKIGAGLKDTVNYRGIFTVDGVMTKDGFRPTELNPRAGAGIKSLIAGCPDLQLELIAQASVSGAKLNYQPESLEKFVIDAADKLRGGGTWKALTEQLSPVDKRFIKMTENGWEWTEDKFNNDGSVSVGPGPLGSSVRLAPNRSSVPIGTSFAPLAKDFWQLIDKDLSSKIGNLEVAKSVR